MKKKDNNNNNNNNRAACPPTIGTGAGTPRWKTRGCHVEGFFSVFLNLIVYFSDDACMSIRLRVPSGKYVRGVVAGATTSAGPS